MAFNISDSFRDIRMLLIGGALGAIVARLSSRIRSREPSKKEELADDVSRPRDEMARQESPASDAPLFPLTLEKGPGDFRRMTSKSTDSSGDESAVSSPKSSPTSPQLRNVRASFAASDSSFEQLSNLLKQGGTKSATATDFGATGSWALGKFQGPEVTKDEKEYDIYNGTDSSDSDHKLPISSANKRASAPAVVKPRLRRAQTADTFREEERSPKFGTTRSIGGYRDEGSWNEPRRFVGREVVDGEPDSPLGRQTSLKMERRASASARIRESVQEDPVAKVYSLCFALRNSEGNADEGDAKGIKLKTEHLDLIEKALKITVARAKEDGIKMFKRRLEENVSANDKQARYFMATCAHSAAALEDDTDEEIEMPRATKHRSSLSRTPGQNLMTKLRKRLRVTLPLRSGLREHRKLVKAKQREMEYSRIQAEQAAICDACGLPTSVTDTVAESMGVLHTWDTFDIFKLKETVASPMPLVTQCSLTGTGLNVILGGALSDTHQVFKLWSDMYNEDNPFHTSLHAADVTQAVYNALTSIGMLDRIPPLRSLAMILSASAHDIGHPGVNNAFLVACSDEIALRYNDRSVLESMHAATAFLLIRQSDVDFWRHLGRDDAQSVRKDMIENILSTDMASHAECQANIEKLADSQPDWTDSATQALLCKAVVHAADISNPARPWNVYWLWTERVMQEFFNQSDLERKHGLKFPGGLSFLSSRTPMNVQQFQLGFIKAVISPFNVYLGKIRDLDHSERLEQLDRNIARLGVESAARQEELDALKNAKKKDSVPEVHSAPADKDHVEMTESFSVSAHWRRQESSKSNRGSEEEARERDRIKESDAAEAEATADSKVEAEEPAKKE